MKRVSSTTQHNFFYKMAVLAGKVIFVIYSFAFWYKWLILAAQRSTNLAQMCKISFLQNGGANFTHMKPSKKLRTRISIDPFSLVTFDCGQGSFYIIMRVGVYYDTTRGSASRIIAQQITRLIFILNTVERSFKCLGFYRLYAVATQLRVWHLDYACTAVVDTCRSSLDHHLDQNSKNQANEGDIFS